MNERVVKESTIELNFVVEVEECVIRTPADKEDFYGLWAEEEDCTALEIRDGMREMVEEGWMWKYRVEYKDE